MSQILLSIIIPTYNRVEYLSENINALVEQCNNHKDYVEIIISDNASNDSTKDFCESLKKSFKCTYIYNRNTTNIGALGNFEKAVGLSTGKYIYLMGDDDILSPNFLDIIMPFLQNNYGIVHWGRLCGNAQCSNNRIHDPQFRKLVEIDQPSVFFSKTLSATNFTSCLIFNRDCWNLGEKHPDVKLEGYGQFARIVWGCLYLNQPCVFYYMPLVIQRNPEKSWAKKLPIYMLYELPHIFYNLDKSINGIYALMMNRLHNKAYYNILEIIYSISNFPSYYKPHQKELLMYLNGIDKFWVWVLINIPIPGKLLYRLYKGIKHRL